MASPEYRQFIVALKARVTAARVGWSRNVLLNRIKAGAYERAVTEKETPNFDLALPEHLPEQADEMLKSSRNLEFLGIRRGNDGPGGKRLPRLGDHCPGWETITPAGKRWPRRQTIAPKGLCPLAQGCGLAATLGCCNACHQPQRGCVRGRKPLCRNRYHPFIFIWCFQRKAAIHCCGTRKSGKKCTPIWVESRSNWIVFRSSWAARRITCMSWVDWPEPFHRPIG
jgi:hypothetical protein